ncbi:NADH-quinone oxidoreductase subunit G [Haematospirillum jordaniae]|uniref:NADH-quinone oxidoreductase n=1 Tax=Haematospirillum jordaniae TaxID=1549855 RepID=A0A143DET0_9PROT|nr:NADH-quinone oxidoreductase subunit NuoG [Haematospirillum jordaniae]AMW35245.1 NADH dehydrogenase [Haematospirillum jordaniae]NKD45599.1 NADH-quinone oxidoreductase subunit G [Haematospirillum jordaniae]NKD56352.1 NADH-quinone oxidoreductase subunit G [Haematospirillum jordaniae]NKD58410.1 NADH-quinone oxidoreductase subunit G [Haematospirillum jordaniae]NKD66421.1 NADH-quinone oxidoreductase subunit G [Haematospirillum jordaniae]
MPKLTIDGIEVEVPAGTTILQAAEQIGIEIPRFCYHERLSIAGNCRMCLVEVQPGPPKPAASCAMPVADGMVVKTNSPMAVKARKGVMEFLLINHPLDCPICDQGGECDLQDQAVAFGYDRSRYREGKRAVKDKYMGPLVATEMTRCIQCTRCVRFAQEVAGVPDLGGVNRGEHMEIGTYVEKAIGSELSGNLVDLCPVGALTSKPYAFNARPWELKKTESIDVFDAIGANIRIDARGNEVLRVLPRLNESVNEEWLGDKSRHAIDGLRRQRLDTPYVRRDGKLVPATWQEAFSAIAARIRGMSGNRMAAIAGDMADAEAMIMLKDLMSALGSRSLECRQDGAALDPDNRLSWQFNSGISGIDEADAILLVGTNPRWEAPVLNARIRKRYMTGQVKIAAVGPQVDLTYRYQHLGTGPETLQALLDGRHDFMGVLKAAKKPMLILGMGALTRKDSKAVLALVSKLVESTGMVRADWNGFNVLHTVAARVGGLELGFVPGPNGRDLEGILSGAEKGEIEFVYLLGADELPMTRLGKAFVVYQGSHGDAGAMRADVILPGAAYTEKSATYLNTEGVVQRTARAVFPPGQAREDWTVIRALSEVIGRKLPQDTLAQVRDRMTAVSPVFDDDAAPPPATWSPLGQSGPVEAAPFASPIRNYYMTDPVSRASATMAECTEVYVNGNQQRKTGTHG